MQTSLKLNQDDFDEIAGTYRVVVHYLGGDTVAGDQFVVEPTRLAAIRLRSLAGSIQDISQQEQFSIKVNDNVVGIHLQHVTHIELEKE